jgi:FkbM family methyltransferase
MQSLKRTKKLIYRKIRYHWLTELIQYYIRRRRALKLAPINLELDVPSDSILIDCGANIGGVTSAFARTGATVYAFEPDPLCFDILAKRFRAIRSVHCLSVGVMDRECTLTLRTPRGHDQWDDLDTTIGATLDPRINSERIRETQISCIDLSSFIKRLNKRVRLLKLDIEGAEIPVLNHLIDTNTIAAIDLVVVETHEKIMPHLRPGTDLLRARIQSAGLSSKIRLDWI